MLQKVIKDLTIKNDFYSRYLYWRYILIGVHIDIKLKDKKRYID